jgi:WD repeat-containing protein 35
VNSFTVSYINDFFHRKLLAEASLDQLVLEMAEKAFVKCSDYWGIQFVKQLHHLDSEVKQRAQVATYFQKFDEAERLYLELDCHNLAVDLRVKLGDWFRVVNFLKKGGGAGGCGFQGSNFNCNKLYYIQLEMIIC